MIKRSDSTIKSVKELIHSTLLLKILPVQSLVSFFVGTTLTSRKRNSLSVRLVKISYLIVSSAPQIRIAPSAKKVISRHNYILMTVLLDQCVSNNSAV